MTALQTLELTNDKLSGFLPPFPSTLTELYLDGNQFTGCFPQSLANFTGICTMIGSNFTCGCSWLASSRCSSSVPSCTDPSTPSSNVVSSTSFTYSSSPSSSSIVPASSICTSLTSCVGVMLVGWTFNVQGNVTVFRQSVPVGQSFTSGALATLNVVGNLLVSSRRDL